MRILDIFNNNAFSHSSMVAALENFEYVPNRLGSMGIFTPESIRTDNISIEVRDNNSLKLIPTSVRGAPLGQGRVEKRRMRRFDTYRIGKGDRIMASELAFVRQFGEADAVKQVQQEVARRWTGPTGLINEVELTLEHMRLGAIQGKMIDADGSVLEDWVTAFDKSGAPATTIPVDQFDLANLKDGELREKLVKIRREMARNSDGVWTPQTKMHVMVGDDFFDALARNPEIRDYYANRVDAKSWVPEYDAFGAIEYAGVVFENYRGTDDQSTVAIATDEGHAFPTNTNGAFMHVKAAGESFADLGTTGKDFYSLITTDEKHDRFVDLELITYPLFVCTRPKMLRKFELV